MIRHTTSNVYRGDTRNVWGHADNVYDETPPPESAVDHRSNKGGESVPKDAILNPAYATCFGHGVMLLKLNDLLKVETRHAAVYGRGKQHYAKVSEAVGSLWSGDMKGMEFLAECPRAGPRELTADEATFLKKYNKSWTMKDSKHPKDWGVCSLLCLSYATLLQRRNTKTMVYTAWTMNVDDDTFNRWVCSG